MRLAPLLAAPPLALCLCALAPRAAHAADVVLDRLAPGAIKLDGKLYEWPGSTPGSEAVLGSGANATFYAGYDDQGIWIGAEVAKSGGVGRTSAFGANEDCVSLVLAFPRAGAWKGAAPLVAYEIGFYAGVPGSSTGAVKVRAGAGAGQTVGGAKLMEASRKGGGYYLEGFVPWSAFPEAKATRAGLRGALRAYDGDGKKLRSIRATGPGSVDAPERLGNLLTLAEQALPADLATRRLTLRDATYEIVADLTGDATHERALLFGHTLFVLGPTFKEGKQYVALDVGSEVASLEARDVTGDSKSDLLFTTRVRSGSIAREALVVWSLFGEKPSRVFAHETAVESSSGEALRDRVTFGIAKGKGTATIAYDAPKVWTAATYREPISTDVDPILLPWGSVKERTFVYSGSSFTKDREASQTPTVVVTTPSPKPSTTTTSVPTKPPPADAAAVFAQYRKDRGIGSDVAPRFVSDVVVMSGRRGRVALYGRDLVVALGGDNAGYAFAAMTRFASASDILEVSVRDATGDARDEIFVRGLVRAKLSGGSGGDKEVVREITTVYTPKLAGSSVQLVPALTIEVARSIGADRVEATLRVGSAKGTIELARGSAKGWSQKTYPFGPEAPTPGLEPLLLPWASESAVVYKWNGEKFVR